jgi:hypothetical protein
MPDPYQILGVTREATQWPYEMAARASAMHRNGRRERLGREKGDYRDQAKSAAGSLK